MRKLNLSILLNKHLKSLSLPNSGYTSVLKTLRSDYLITYYFVKIAWSKKGRGRPHLFAPIPAYLIYRQLTPSQSARMCCRRWFQRYRLECNVLPRNDFFSKRTSGFRWVHLSFPNSLKRHPISRQPITFPFAHNFFSNARIRYFPLATSHHNDHCVVPCRLASPCLTHSNYKFMPIFASHNYDLLETLAAQIDGSLIDGIKRMNEY